MAQGADHVASVWQTIPGAASLAHFLGVPQEVTEQAMLPLLTAIAGFAVQDYAKARDAPKA